jgi:hypothetical protein
VKQLKDPKPNPAIIAVAMRIGALAAHRDVFDRNSIQAKDVGSWFLAFAQWAYVSWLLANFVADNGGRASSNAIYVHLSHADWALQSHDVFANILVFTLIAIAQFLKFVYVMFSIKPYKNIFSKGPHFALAVIAFGLTFAALLWRLNMVDHQTYSLYLPNSTVFVSVWILTSIIAFAGTTGFWKHAGLGLWNLLTKKNSK